MLKKRLSYKVDSQFTKEDHENSIQNFKNLQIFADIKPTITLKKDGTLKIDYEFEEAVTFIPFIVPSASGAGFNITVGFFENNTFGLAHTSVYTLGYDSGSNTVNTSLSYTARELFNSDYTVNTGLRWVDSKTIFKVKYEDETDENKNELYAGGWGANNLGAHMIVSYPVFSSLSLGLGFDIARMKFTDDSEKIDEVITNSNAGSSLTLPEKNTQFSAMVTASFGTINVDKFLANGYYVSTSTKVPTDKLDEEEKSGMNYKGSFKGFLTFNKDWLHVTKLNINYTDSSLAQNLTTVQNTSMIRGTPENIYWGKGTWNATQEVRIPVFQTQNWLYKLALFSDFGQTIEAPDFLTERNEKADEFILSVGGGFRAFFKKITALGIIMDVGYQIKPESNLNFRFHLREMVPF